MSFDFGAIGSTEDILNGLTFIPSVTDIIFLDTFVTVNVPSHFAVLSMYTLTRSPGRMRYLVAGGTFNCSDLCILYYATIVSISVLANLKVLKRSVWLKLMLDIQENFGHVPNTSSDGPNPFGPIVSLSASMDRVRMILSSSVVYSDFVTSNILLSG